MDSSEVPPLAASRALPPRVSMAVCVHSAPGVYALLLGSGISSAAGIRTGWGIMQDLARKVASLLEQSDEQVAFAEETPDLWWREHFSQSGELTYSNLLGELGPAPGARQKLLQEYFAGRTPTRAHHAIAELVRDGFIRVILTTNFDPLLEEALQAKGVPPQTITVAQASTMLPIAHGGPPTVVKLHGDFRQLDMRNTTDELDTYPPAWAQLVREVLRDFGLIVCGWSAEWDRALVECLSQRESHRFPVFWSAFHTPTGRAAELVAQLKASVIADTSADDLFASLSANVAALQRLADLPPTREMALSRLKQTLADPAHRIDLFDLLDQHAGQLVDRIGDQGRYPAVRGEMAAPAYQERLDAYRADGDTLLHLLATGVFHDRQAEHAHVWERMLQRLVDTRTHFDSTVAAKAEHYPALLALHAAGCAAVLNGREDILARLLTRVSWHNPLDGAARPVGEAVRTFDVLAESSLLAQPNGGLANPSWQSSRLRGELREPLAEACAHSDRAFTAAFDRLEYLMLLVHHDLAPHMPLNTAPTFLAPRVFRADQVAAHDTVAALVARDLRPGWAMLAGGAFGGDAARAQAAADKIRTSIGSGE
ncbi:SIR2 family protein [Kitasatospora sp. NPDC088783]|uniref:SIR2 family protein n=1 Tax=Kitasatospora sp. NPDC088783 TaxID=3364077 RepID=UPI0037F7F6CB